MDKVKIGGIVYPIEIKEEAGLEQEEDKINRLGNVLHQVLTDNDFSFLRNEAT